QYLLRDLRCAVFVQHGFAVRPHHRQAELDEAHAAVAGDGQLGMIAVMRHLDAGERAGLQHRCGLRFALPVRHQLRHFNLASAHPDPDLLDRRRRGFGFGCCCCWHFYLTQRRKGTETQSKKTFASWRLGVFALKIECAHVNAADLAIGLISCVGPALRTALCASSAAPLASNSSLNFFTKLSTGQAHASPNAQMVRPWMFWAMF